MGIGFLSDFRNEELRDVPQPLLIEWARFSSQLFGGIPIHLASVLVFVFSM